MVRLTLLLAVFTGYCYCIILNPVFHKAGDIEIVCLFDIHTRMSGGQCEGFDKQMMELAYTVLWEWERLNSTLQSQFTIGLSVYDVCGSNVRSIEIISQYINQENKTLFGGVISYTDISPTTAISHMLHHLHIPHIEYTSHVIKQDWTEFDNKLVLSMASENRVQAAIDAMAVLNWTYVSVYSLNTSSATSERKLFSSKLKQNKICEHVQTVLPDRLSNLQLPESVPKGVILFTGDELTRNIISQIEKGLDNKVLIVGGLSGWNFTDKASSKDIMLLLEHYTEIEGLPEFISSQQTILNISGNTPDLYLDAFACGDIENITSETCDLPWMKSRRLHVTVDSVKTMFNSLSTLLKMDCDYSKRDDCLPASLMTYHSNGGQVESWKPYLELISLGVEDKVLKDNSSVSNLHGSVKVQGQLPRDLFNSHCFENCLVCEVCSAKYSSSEKIILQKADIFIVGSFPIYRSESDQSCTEANPPGLQAARAFLSAIETFKTRYNDTIALQNITIGGVVFDSCSYTETPDSRVSDIESCIYDYHDASQQVINLPPVRTSAYFNFYENIDHVTKLQSSPKLSAVVSTLGFGLEQHLYEHYVEALTKVLHKIKWTYFKIIHSTNPALKQMVQDVIKSVTDSDLCVADVIEIGPDVDDYLPRSTLADKNGIGTLLFTTEDDTAKILDSFQSINNSNIKQKLFIFPWNMKALVDIKRPIFLENALLLRPKHWPVTPDVTNTISDDVIPWMHDFQTPTNTSLSKDVESTVVVGVDLIISTINAVYRDLCPEQTGICREFSDFRDLKPRLETTFSMLLAGMESPFELHDFRMANNKLDAVQIGEVEVNGNVSLELSKLDNTRRSYLDVSSSTCRTWCPKCYRCKQGSTLIPDLIYSPGDIILTGIFPIHDPGSSPFTCGQLSDTVLSSQNVEAFMYAIESAQLRYPYLLNEVRVGGMILDSCSHSQKAVQLIGNFESCDFAFDQSEHLAPSPKTNLAYIVHGDNSSMDIIGETVAGLGKLSVTTYKSLKDSTQISSDSGVNQTCNVIVDMLVKLNWTYIYLVTSDAESYADSLNTFLQVASKRGVCIGKILALGSSVESIVQVAKYLDEGSTAVVVMTRRFDIKLFFNNQESRESGRPWIIDISGDDWNSEGLTDVQLPYGTLLIDKHGKRNQGFETFMSNFNITSPGLSDWWRKYWKTKFNCIPPCNFELLPIKNRPFSAEATRVIRSVDIALHAIHAQYLASCPLTSGLCRNFVTAGIPLIPSKAKHVYFQEGDEKVEFVDDVQLVRKYQIKTYSSNQQYEVGVWRDGVLTLQGSFFQYLPSSTCSTNCQCKNQLKFTNTSVTAANDQLTAQLIFWKTSGVFNGKMWATVLVAIAATGAFISIILIVYVSHKVCNRTLARRYVGLGILLLFGVMLLFLSVVPFVFTPSETMCGLRFVMPSCTYAFSFAIILVKLTSLRDYRLIGLGGEVSNLNQYIFVVFITAVQIAIGLQWWIMKTPLVITITSDMNTIYACKFDQVDFILHHVYVMILIMLCSVYAIGVRQETKNMGEARLLLWCCWLCIPIWIVWIVVFLVQAPEYSEPTACVAIVSCATLMMTVIFIPKIHMVAKIKYSISKGASSFQNGYTLDSEFFYERPYSLPGTMTTNYSTMKTHPRSISNFDATLSY